MSARLALAMSMSVALFISACAHGASEQTELRHQAEVASALGKQVNLPVYPGAVATQGGGAELRHGSRAITAVYYRTGDALPKVERFYASRFPKGALKEYINTGAGGLADFSMTRGRNVEQVTLSSDSDGTVIALMLTRQDEKGQLRRR